MNKVLTYLFVLLLIACTAKQEKISSVLLTSDAGKQDTLPYYDLHEIQSSGTIIAGTLSGPDTYYEYHGKEMGAQFKIAEAFAQSIGVVLQMEPDTLFKAGNAISIFINLFPVYIFLAFQALCFLFF